MKISKKDALMWFEFFAQLPEDEQLRGKLEDTHRCLNSRM